MFKRNEDVFLFRMRIIVKTDVEEFIKMMKVLRQRKSENVFPKAEG